MSLVEETLTTGGTQSGSLVECQYETSDGGGGNANMYLTEAGTGETGYRLLLSNIEIDYEVEGSSEGLTLGAGNY